MRHYQEAGWALLAGVAAFAFGLQPASAAQQQREEGSIEQGAEVQRESPDPQSPMARPGQRGEKGQQRSAAQSTTAQPGQAECGAQSQPYVLGPVVPSTGKAFGAGIGAQEGQPGGISPIQGGGSAPLPQYWLADAALFAGSAASAANALALEHALSVPSPAVLGNQAQFLIAATNRALSSLNALQQDAEATNPAAVAEIRNAVGQLVAAQGAAAQVANAASTGVVGPAFDATTRAALQHLTAAEKAMTSIGRTYNAPALASIGSCPMRGAFGAGLGPAHKAPAKEPAKEPVKEPAKEPAPPAQP